MSPNSFNTTSLNYFFEILKFLSGAIVVGVGLIFTEIVFPNILVIQVLRGILVFTFLELLISLLFRAISVSDNKEIYLIRNKKYNFKYEPIYLCLNDVKFLLENSDNPETLYVGSKTGNYHVIQISFDITGRRGEFYNKHFVIDDEVIYEEKRFLNKLYDKGIINDGQIKVYATFDNNKPDVILSIIENLKNKN